MRQVSYFVELVHNFTIKLLIVYFRESNFERRNLKNKKNSQIRAIPSWEAPVVRQSQAAVLYLERLYASSQIAKPQPPHLPGSQGFSKGWRSRLTSIYESGDVLHLLEGSFSAPKGSNDERRRLDLFGGGSGGGKCVCKRERDAVKSQVAASEFQTSKRTREGWISKDRHNIQKLARKEGRIST